MRIERGFYTGYVWKSDEKTPITLNGREEYELELSNSVNPFVIEAQLYDESHKLSYSVKYVDGEYIVAKHEGVYPTMAAERENIELKSYLGRRMNGKMLQFLQIWEEMEDVEVDETGDRLCEGMKTLRPTKLFFVGFDK